MKTVFEHKPDYFFFLMITAEFRAAAHTETVLPDVHLCHLWPFYHDFILDNAELMRKDKNGVYHCLLVTGENHRDGILIEEFRAAAHTETVLPDVHLCHLWPFYDHVRHKLPQKRVFPKLQAGRRLQRRWMPSARTAGRRLRSGMSGRRSWRNSIRPGSLRGPARRLRHS